jgi:hypothetical protein
MQWILREVTAIRMQRVEGVEHDLVPGIDLTAEYDLLQRLDGELASLISRAMHAARLAASMMMGTSCPVGQFPELPNKSGEAHATEMDACRVAGDARSLQPSEGCAARR